jgi:hypothetical protein
VAKINSTGLMKQVYSARAGRKFGLTVGIAFLVIAALAYWRGRDAAPRALGVLAALLVAAALIVPRQLEPVERAWMKLAHVISRVTTPVFMGIVYFVVLTPIGIIRRTFGGNPLVHRAGGNGYWIERVSAHAEARRKRMERQF